MFKVRGWGRGHRQRIDIASISRSRCMRDAEALLLVDDE